jgi:hypothetical protein
MKNKIYVLYVGISGIREEDIKSYVHKVAEKITPTSVEGEIIIIPTQSPYTKIECINPVYITKKELIIEHTKKMNNLQEELQHQLDILKNK